MRQVLLRQLKAEYNYCVSAIDNLYVKANTRHYAYATTASAIRLNMQQNSTPNACFVATTNAQPNAMPNTDQILQPKAPPTAMATAMQDMPQQTQTKRQEIENLTRQIDSQQEMKPSYCAENDFYCAENVFCCTCEVCDVTASMTHNLHWDAFGSEIDEQYPTHSPELF